MTADGFQIATASDGREGMKLIVTWDPHLVVSDWMMPHVDGLELCQSVKTGLKELAPYFILLTAKGEINDRLLPLHRNLFLEANPIPVKWAVQQLGLIEGGIRLPLTPLSAACHEQVREAIRHAGVRLEARGERYAAA